MSTLRLKQWDGEWKVVATGQNPYELAARAAGEIGDDWTIDCETHPNTICFYGCGLCRASVDQRQESTDSKPVQ